MAFTISSPRVAGSRSLPALSQSRAPLSGPSLLHTPRCSVVVSADPDAGVKVVPLDVSTTTVDMAVDPAAGKATEAAPVGGKVVAEVIIEEPIPEPAPMAVDPETGDQLKLPASSIKDEMDAMDELPLKKVLVVGATGRTGEAIVNKLTREGISVVALVRGSSLSKARRELPLCEIVEADITNFSSLPKVMEEVDQVVIASGCTGKDFLNPLAPYNVEYRGAANVIIAAQQAKVKKIVLISSIGVGTGSPLLDTVAWGVLFWKNRTEEMLQRMAKANPDAPFDYTIIRPGGLKSGMDAGGSSVTNVRMNGAGGTDLMRGLKGESKGSMSIQRAQVADVVAEALISKDAVNKIVEVVASKDAPLIPIGTLFASV